METNWDDHRFFLAIARERSLTAAGRSLGVSQPTVSRRLDALESKLKVRLFDRTPAGYELTSVGMDLFETAQRIEEDFAEIGRKIYGQDQQLAGGLRVTCTQFLLDGYLAPHVWEFLTHHPGINLSITCTRSPLNLSRNDADLALRFTRNPPETLAGRRLAACAYSAYLARSPAGEKYANAPRQEWDWIGIPDDNWDRMMFNNGVPEGNIKHRVDSMAAIQSMVRSGLGVGILPCYVADRDETLCRIEPETLLDLDLDIWLLYHPDNRNVQRIRVFADFIIDLVLSDADLFEGGRPL